MVYELGLPGRESAWTPQRKSALATNIVNHYNATPEHLKSLGSQFFPRWQDDARLISSHLGQEGTEHGAAILAHLSPSTEADANRMMAYQTIHLDPEQTAHIHAAAELESQRRQLSYQAKQDPGANMLYHQLARQISVHRRSARIAGTPLDLQTNQFISHALKVRDGQYADPLGSLGGFKREDFGRNIASGGNERRQTIDTHYHDAILNRTDIPYDAERGLQAKGRYEGLSQAADMAHQRLLTTGQIHPEFNRPNDMMAAVWHRQQTLKAQGGRSAAESRNASFLQAAGSHLYNPETYGGAPIGLDLSGGK